MYNNHGKLEKLSVEIQDESRLLYMDTKHYATEYRLVHWAGVMQEREESGLSIRAFCEQAGFHENRYFYWQKKLREMACEGLAKIQSKTTGLTPMFAEVKIPAKPVSQAAVSNLPSGVCIEAAGIRITAGDEYPVEKLASLLRSVIQPCC